MAGKITYFKLEDFNRRGDFCHHGSECKINDLVFRKSNTFGHHEIKEVLDICNKYQNFDTNTLIVKGDNDLTIWIEDKSQRPKSQTQAAATSPNSPSLPTKTVTRRYRGQVYEEEVVDLAAIQQASQQKKLRRKYRGQYID